MVIWLTGLSGSGKTTIGRHILSLWRRSSPNTAFVDGDDVRRILAITNDDTAFTLEGRREVAERIAAICSWLDAQDIHVVCSTISLFDDLHEANNRKFSKYFEVYIDVPMETLARRDDKNLYAPAYRGEIHNVMGVDLPFSPPKAPDMVIDNSEDRADLRDVAEEILSRALDS